MSYQEKRVAAYLAAYNRADGAISTATFDRTYARLLSEMKKNQAQQDLEQQHSLCEV